MPTLPVEAKKADTLRAWEKTVWKYYDSRLSTWNNADVKTMDRQYSVKSWTGLFGC